MAGPFGSLSPFDPSLFDPSTFAGSTPMTSDGPSFAQYATQLPQPPQGWLNSPRPEAPPNESGGGTALTPSTPGYASSDMGAPQSQVSDSSLIGRLRSLLSGNTGQAFQGVGDAAGNWIANNRNTLMALGAGMAGAQNLGQGLSRGMGAAIPAMQTDQRQQIMNQTAQALIRRGLSPDVAMAAATNPAIMQQILPSLFGPKQYAITEVTDALGNKRPVAYNPVNPREAFELNIQQAGQSGSVAPLRIDSSLQGEDYLKQFPPEIQAAVHDYIEGKQMPTGNPRLGPAQNIKLIAQKYGNDIGAPVDDATFAERHKMRTDIGSSSPNTMGGIISNGKSAFDHLAGLSDKYAALGNYNGPSIPGGATIGAVGNVVANRVFPTPDFEAKVQGANDNALKYGQEATKFYAGSGGGEAERMAALHNIDPRTSSSLSQAEFLQTERDLMLGRLHEKENQIRGTLGNQYLQDHPVVTPELQGTIAHINANIAKLRGQQTSPPVLAPQGGPTAGPAPAAPGPQAASAPAPAVPPAQGAPTAPPQAPTQSSPVRVGSIEEALRLPKGTVFMTPDGRTKVR